ncbi:nucleoside deaminase [Flagellimonas algicola]|uniref:Nucleoside deaminase n=1 Tax=Flagellimonas algicola TaxID=2583815 RepID=A0ABY2WJ57_9FLAO|nr:deaminase [Allomuricauda algicola]TMU54675.1 nucleoside deaminase [Allomuricauda algicola]
MAFLWLRDVMKNATYFMERCEVLAGQAASKGNSAVGSLIVVDDTIIAEAEEAATSQQDVSCHAEMEAIRRARAILGKDMSNVVLYSNKEPCVMCSYAIRVHRIGTVIYKEKSGEMGGANGTFDVLASENVPEGWGPPVHCIQLEQN